MLLHTIHTLTCWELCEIKDYLRIAQTIEYLQVQYILILNSFYISDLTIFFTNQRYKKCSVSPMSLTSVGRLRRVADLVTIFDLE